LRKEKKEGKEGGRSPEGGGLTHRERKDEEKEKKRWALSSLGNNSEGKREGGLSPEIAFFIHHVNRGEGKTPERKRKLCCPMIRDKCKAYPIMGRG